MKRSTGGAFRPEQFHRESVERLRAWRWLVAWRALLLLFALSGAATFSATNDPPAKLSVSGYGIFGNRELKNLLTVLEKPGARPATFDANFIEDAVLVLFSRLNRDGYLQPKIQAAARFSDGTEQTFTWREPLGEPLPRPFAAKRIKFQIDPGVLFFFQKVNFAGVEAIRLKEAAHFFIETDAIIFRKRNRVFSPERLRTGLKNLQDALERKGYESASVTTNNLVVNTNTGAVTVDIIVKQGPISLVQSIREEIISADTNVPPKIELIHTNTVYSRVWQEDFAQSLRREEYQTGHADVRVTITQAARELRGGTNYIDLLAKVFPGAQIHVGQVVFLGEKKTRKSMMNRRVDIHAGDLLNPIKAERGRYRLARLGIFDSVELKYDHVDEDTRDVEYQVKEGKTINFSLLAGYGSYEKLRGGFELEQNNLWGLAHYQRLKAIQSFKSSEATYTYTMPEIFGEDFDAFLNASGLLRQEISFQRREFGGGAGVARHLRDIASDVSVRYNYQVLSALQQDFTPPPEYGLQEATVGSFILELRHDRQDNPLMPRKGYKVYSTLELASPALFGDADYQRMETSFAYHHPVGKLEWIHVGLSHGFVTTPGNPALDLPFNKRFFPGGDNSIRGFQFGEAAARDENGVLVGSESYLLGNFEFEQGLTKNWSIVGFFDALGQARRIQNYPLNEELYSVGIGIRWNTMIGPVRLEYGHNLNPRPSDPSGTVHFSIGFPF